jgi:hypothetical protein
MLQAVEAIIEKGTRIQFAELLEFPTTRQHVLVILLNSQYNSLKTEGKSFVNSKAELDVPKAVARLRKLSQGIRWKTGDGMSIREAIEEGRR